MNIGLKALCDDPLKLKEIIGKRDETIHQQQRRINQLEELVRLQKHRQFGASSEKSSDQGELFDEAEELLDTEENDAETELNSNTDIETSAATPQAKKSGRKPLPAELPRVRIEHDLAESDKTCQCGCQLTLVGEETSEQLDIVPAKLRVLVHARKKYACKACEEQIKLSPLPPQPIPKSMASPGLLRWFAVVSPRSDL